MTRSTSCGQLEKEFTTAIGLQVDGDYDRLLRFGMANG